MLYSSFKVSLRSVRTTCTILRGFELFIFSAELCQHDTFFIFCIKRCHFSVFLRDTISLFAFLRKNMSLFVFLHKNHAIMLHCLAVSFQHQLQSCHFMPQSCHFLSKRNHATFWHDWPRVMPLSRQSCIMPLLC